MLERIPLELLIHQLPRQSHIDAGRRQRLVALITRLIERGTYVWDSDRNDRLSAAKVGVVCAHVSQVNAVRERLPRQLAEVFVETSDRFQGWSAP